MGFKVVINGMTVEAQSPADVLALVQLASMAPQGAPETGSSIDTPGHPSDVQGDAKPEKKNGTVPAEQWAKLMEALGEERRRVLAAIRANDGITLDKLAEATVGNVKRANNAVSGLLTGIYRKAEKHGIRVSLLWKREESGTGPRRVIRYRVGAALKAHEVPV